MKDLFNMDARRVIRAMNKAKRDAAREQHLLDVERLRIHISEATPGGVSWRAPRTAAREFVCLVAKVWIAMAVICLLTLIALQVFHQMSPSSIDTGETRTIEMPL